MGLGEEHGDGEAVRYIANPGFADDGRADGLGRPLGNFGEGGGVLDHDVAPV